MAHGEQNGVTPSPGSRASVSPFASVSSEPPSSKDLGENRASQSGEGGPPASGWGTILQSELLAGQSSSYQGPPNLDPAAVSNQQGLVLCSWHMHLFLHCGG